MKPHESELDAQKKIARISAIYVSKEKRKYIIFKIKYVQLMSADDYVSSIFSTYSTFFFLLKLFNINKYDRKILHLS